MKIAVTGGAGFIGSKITDEYIKNGHEVVIIDNLSTGKRENLNPKAKFYELNINDDKIPDIFAEEKFDILSHHAAQMNVRVSVDDPRYDAVNNILGGLSLFEACRKTGVKKVIFASSGGVIYGDQDYFPADEEHPTRPCSPYGISKLSTEKYLYYYKKVYGLDYVIFRYTNVYGPRQNPHGEAGVVAIFINKMLNGEQPVINGDGTFTRDYLFVSDVVRANLIALQPEVRGIFNLSTGIEKDVNFIFSTLKDLTGSDCSQVHGPAKDGEQARSVCTYEKFYKFHGWKPEIDFEKGLSMTVEYFRNKYGK